MGIEFLLLLNIVGTTVAGAAPWPSFDWTPESLNLEWQKAREESERNFEALENRVDSLTTFADLRDGIDQLTRPLDRMAGLFLILHSAEPRAEIRDKADELIVDHEEALQQAYTSQKIYRALKRSVPQTPSEAFHRRMFLEKFEGKGIDLKSDDKEILDALQLKLTKLSVDFENNINLDKAAHIFSTHELDGLPEDFLQSTRIDQTNRHRVFASRWDHFSKINNGARSEKTRELINRLRLRRGYPRNIELLKAMVRLRSKIAALQKQKSWLASELKNTYFSNPKKLQRFLENTRVSGFEKFSAVQEILTHLKMEETGQKKAKLRYSDYDYFIHRWMEKRLGFDEQKFAQYFRLQDALPRMLDIMAGVLQIRIHERADIPKWHPSVRTFVLEDARSGEGLGAFYFDLYPRDGKETWFLVHELQVRSDSSLPSAAMIANFESPTAPMNLEDLETLFHEVGHLFQFVLPTSKFSAVNMPPELMEAHSGLFEDWMWQAGVLSKIATPLADGKNIPREFLDALGKIRTLTSSVKERLSLANATIDAGLHSGAKNPSPYKTSRSAYRSLFSPLPSGVTNTSSFSHLSDYAGTFWSYVFGQRVAEGLVERFRKSPEGSLDSHLGLELRQTFFEPLRDLSARDLLKGTPCYRVITRLRNAFKAR